MKTTVLSLVFFITCIFGAHAQIHHAVDPNEFLIAFADDTEDDVINYYRDSVFFATEVWESPLSETRLWRFISFPFTMDLPDGSSMLVSNIIGGNTGVHNHKQNSSDLEGDGLNPFGKVSYTISSGPVSSLGSSVALPCNNIDYFLPQSDVPVRVAIVDSGVEQDITGSDEYPFEPNIVHIKDYVNTIGNNFNTGIDENNHGTHLLSIINLIANKENPYNFENEVKSNISFDIRRILNAENQGTLADLILAVEEAIVDGAKVINLSLGFYATENNTFFMERLLNVVEENNVLLVVSAGNEGWDLDDDHKVLPAALQSPNLVTVGGLKCNRRKMQQSNFSEHLVDVAIPGEAVPGYGIDGEIHFFDGTSQSAAMVTGIAALLATHQDNFSPQEIKCALIEGSIKRSFLVPHFVSGGFVHASRALTKLNQGCTTIYGSTIQHTDGLVIGDVATQMFQSANQSSSTVFPNPFEKDLNIKLTKGDYVLSVVNMQGQIIVNKTITIESSETWYKLDLSQIPNNHIHMISILDNLGQHSVHKIIRQ